jgi:hypothetical protein
VSTSSEQDNRAESLLKALIEKQVITAAQAEVARYDSVSQGVTPWDSLRIRGWVNETVLIEHAPWLGKSKEDTQPTAINADSYEENLKRYEELMREMLGQV